MENTKVKKIPLRKCLGCMESFPKKELVRVVRTPEGDVCIDLTGKKSGRGAYICKSEACLKKAIKSKRIQNNLEVTLSDELAEALAKEISGENR
ncbi:MAG: YlxR family protein [Clostridia bacterium]|nr:YlxR family protein [Clostridia bacterium]